MDKKDFAFLFYVNDWAGGTQWLTRLQRGAYIDLLLYQVNNTCFSLEEVKSILGADFEHCWSVLERKFQQENGKFYNEKMRKVLESRQKFTQSRRNNRLGKVKKQVKNTRKTLVKQVGNENENVIGKEIEIYPSFNDFWNLYGKKVGRHKTEKKWGKLTQSEREKIIKALPKYVACTPDIQYRKNPETYLNSKSWDDEIIVRSEPKIVNKVHLLPDGTPNEY